MIVPTGVGAAIGGYAGDALPVARALSSIVDCLITHPNVCTQFISIIFKAMPSVTVCAINLLCENLIKHLSAFLNNLYVLCDFLFFYGMLS